MSEVIFRRGADFEAEAASSDYFESGDQIRLAARALQRASFLTREQDAHGGSYLRVAKDITAEDLAFVTSAEQQRLEEGH